MNTLKYLIKKYNIDTNGPLPINIIINRSDLAKLFAELKFNKGAEIGVGGGVFSEILCKTNPKLTMYCIDPWKPYAGYIEHTSQESLDEIYKDALIRLKPYSCHIIRDFSENAYKNFKDESLDFVYIDGNHDAVHVKQDIELWSPKVKRNGIIAGNNFVRYKGRYGLYNQVKDTVTAYAVAKKISPWFALRSPGEHTSWMWINTITPLLKKNRKYTKQNKHKDVVSKKYKKIKTKVKKNLRERK